MAKKKSANPLFRPPRYKGYIYNLTPAMRRWLLTQDPKPFDKGALAVLLNKDLVPAKFRPSCSKLEFDGRA